MNGHVQHKTSHRSRYVKAGGRAVVSLKINEYLSWESMVTIKIVDVGGSRWKSI